MPKAISDDAIAASSPVALQIYLLCMTHVMQNLEWRSFVLDQTAMICIATVLIAIKASRLPTQVMVVGLLRNFHVYKCIWDFITTLVTYKSGKISIIFVIH